MSSRTDLHVQRGTWNDQIYRDISLQQRVCLFWGAKGGDFIQMSSPVALGNMFIPFMFRFSFVHVLFIFVY